MKGRVWREEIDLRQAFFFGAPEPCVAVEYQQGERHLRPLIESKLRRVHRALHPNLPCREFQQGEGVQSVSTATLDHPVEASLGSPGSTPEPGLAVALISSAKTVNPSTPALVEKSL
jgi:hypothetical protein